ncbi:hypothetical protein GRF59_14665 [Paenibacillus sp. HJL G12]|uniref:Uncharacterized protein n=1 Tax=Paenibacillus dendrobii TaxID=2691084 RepID=A0A7X3IK15_9BACL|nr:hypothetical protein [Paenibacillus dendrobii]MWV44861.1 hypothetical protein [Paenibacillus dendrobii]
MRQTEEDLKIVKRYLELPYLLDVLELDKKKMKESSLKMSRVYSIKLEEIQDLVTKDIYEVKNEMRIKGIKIIEQTKHDDRLIADYSCRNYKHQITLLWSKVKFDTEVSLANYLGIVIDKLFDK